MRATTSPIPTTDNKKRPFLWIACAVLIVSGLVGGRTAAGASEEESQSVAPPETAAASQPAADKQVTEARRYYDSITWKDVASSGPPAMGYIYYVVQQPARDGNIALIGSIPNAQKKPSVVVAVRDEK